MPSRFFDDRAPPSGPRSRRNYRAKCKCDDCGAEPGEVHAADCQLGSRMIG